MIYVMMENMLRWRAGHGAATAGENSFLLLGPETYKLSGRVRSGRWAQETKVKVLQQRREVAATGSSCHIGQDR